MLSQGTRGLGHCQLVSSTPASSSCCLAMSLLPVTLTGVLCCHHQSCLRWGQWAERGHCSPCYHAFPSEGQVFLWIPHCTAKAGLLLIASWRFRYTRWVTHLSKNYELLADERHSDAQTTFPTKEKGPPRPGCWPGSYTRAQLAPSLGALCGVCTSKFWSPTALKTTEHR